MGFYLIFQRSFLKMLGLKRTIGITVVAVLGMVIFTGIGFAAYQQMSLTIQTQEIADRIAIVWYVWGSGLLLTMMIVSSAAGFISGEVSDGTMVILLAKPVNRYQIIMGKLLALIVHSVLLLSFSYVFSILILWGLLHLDMDGLKTLLGMLPAFMLYLLLVAVFFGSIVTALTSLLGGRIKTMLIGIALVIYAFFGGTIIRAATQFEQYVSDEDISQYERLKIYVFDIGYHLGNTYDLVTRQVSFWQISPAQSWTLGNFTGTYAMPLSDSDGSYFSTDGILYPNPTGYMNPALSLMIVLLVSAGCCGIAVWGFNRKQI